MERISIVMQARMGSERLPGKVLMKSLGVSLLEWEVSRLKRSKLASHIIVATTDAGRDDEIVKEAKRLGVDYFRGSEADVLSRFYHAAIFFKSDWIVRVCGDCPLIDPVCVDEVINAAVHSQISVDYGANILDRRYPRGMDTEVFTLAALAHAYNEASSISDREHVTPYITRNTNLFKYASVRAPIDRSNFRFVVDTKEDFEFVDALLTGLAPRIKDFNLSDLISYLDKNKQLLSINAHIQQKSI